MARRSTSSRLDAAIVLVAHDRWFLEAVGTSVLELEAGRGRFFAGPWHAWRKEKAARELALGRAVDRQEAEIARLERFVERFRAKASKARQAQSRVKRLEKMERVQRDPGEGRSLAFSFAQPERSGRVVFELEGGRIEVPGRVLLEDADLWVERGEHVTLVGANGSGKTTLVQTLTGALALPKGKLRTGHNVTVGYVSQHAEELTGHGTVLDAVQRATGLTPGKARALLGRFLFSGEDAEKPVDGLSGGELRRLSLALLVHSGANMLVLDEPTNHLDVESREALEDALTGYSGSLLLVSHDRALLDAVGTRTVAIDDGRLRSFEGGWTEYVEAREARLASENGESRPAEPKKAKAAARPRRQARSGPSKNAQRDQRRLERRDRGRGVGAASPGGRAGRPGRLGGPGPGGGIVGAPRRRPAPARGAVRALGGRGRLRPPRAQPCSSGPVRVTSTWALPPPSARRTRRGATTRSAARIPYARGT